MDGERGDFEEPTASSPPIDLPATLVALDDENARGEAIASIREAVEEEPGACAPTIPKLRDLLEGERIEGPADAETIAYCLAEIAEASPTDVAPSADALVDAVAATYPSRTATEGLRALAAIGEEKPEAVESRSDRLVRAIGSGSAHGPGSPRLWAVLDRLDRCLGSVSLTGGERDPTEDPDSPLTVLEEPGR